MSESFRCGLVGLVGRTNAGKSTLLNRLVGEKVAIVSPVPQTTRHLIRGVVHRDDAQLVFVDTPGLHRPQREMNARMLDLTHSTMQGVDLLLHVIDATVKPKTGEAMAAQRVREAGVPHVIALNKVDLVKPKSRLLPRIEQLAEAGASAIVPVSATSGNGVDGLLEELVKLLPEAPPIYPKDLTSDQAERFYIAELIREKILLATRQEVPHAAAVILDAVETREAKAGEMLVVQASILVEKVNQRGILIGKGGQQLKAIGTAARKDVEKQLNVKCHLELFVKVQDAWRQDERVLREVLADPRSGTEVLVDELDVSNDEE
ncbi:MAG: GTPase Era [Acidobacteriota bacterium]